MRDHCVTGVQTCALPICDTRGHRYSPLKQINRDNIARLAPKWVFPLTNTSPLQGTPVVAGGPLDVTLDHESYTGDAGSRPRDEHPNHPLAAAVTSHHIPRS